MGGKYTTHLFFHTRLTPPSVPSNGVPIEMQWKWGSNTPALPYHQYYPTALITSP